MDWNRYLNSKNKLVAPSILSADFANLESEIKKIENFGADWIHVDVMDGHFVPNLTIGAPVVKALRKTTTLPLDVHLMIEKPEKFIRDFIDAGSDIITLHVESTNQIKDLLAEIRRNGRKAGITLRPRTSLIDLIPYLDQVDLVLVMTVEPGFGGQSFMEDQVKKIDELYRLRQEKKYSFLIEVDGGINDKTAHMAGRSDVFVAGNYVFKHPSSMKEAIQSLQFPSTNF